MTKQDGYQWDVFISYPSQEHHKKWVHNIFLDLFELHLCQELGTEPSIFIDTQAIKNGDAWKARLKSALAYSRILIPIWSVDYFRSAWCRGECVVMHYRELRLGFRTLENPRGLIVPVKLFDGKRYPQFAQDIHHRDFTPYNLSGDFFKHSKGYLDLETEIQSWVKQVAEAIRQAPAWSSEWKSDEWIEEPLKLAETSPQYQPKVLAFEHPSLAEGIP